MLNCPYIQSCAALICKTFQFKLHIRSSDILCRRGVIYLHLNPVEALRVSSSNHSHSYSFRLHSPSPSLKQPSLPSPAATSFLIRLSKSTLLQPKRNQIKIQLLFRKTKLCCIFAPALSFSCGGGCMHEGDNIDMSKDIGDPGLLLLTTRF